MSSYAEWSGAKAGYRVLFIGALDGVVERWTKWVTCDLKITRNTSIDLRRDTRSALRWYAYAGFEEQDGSDLVVLGIEASKPLVIRTASVDYYLKTMRVSSPV